MNPIQIIGTDSQGAVTLLGTAQTQRTATRWAEFACRPEFGDFVTVTAGPVTVTRSPEGGTNIAGE